MRYIVRLPDNYDEGLTIACFGGATSLIFVPVEQTKLPVRATLIIPGNCILFAELPQPGRLLSDKQRHQYIINNMPEEILFNSEYDKIIIWSSEKDKLVYAIINRALWEYWIALCEKQSLIYFSLLPEWMLLPWFNAIKQPFSAHFNHRQIVRVSFWQGYTVPVNSTLPQLSRKLAFNKTSPGLPINHKMVFQNILSLPFPAKARWAFNKHFFYQKLKALLNGVLTGVILFQIITLAHDGQYYYSLPAVYKEAPFVQDNIYPALMALDKASEGVQYQLKSLHFNLKELRIDIVSHSTCNNIIEQFNHSGLTVRNVQQKTAEFPFQCSMTAGIAVL